MGPLAKLWDEREQVVLQATRGRAVGAHGWKVGWGLQVRAESPGESCAMAGGVVG